MLILSRFFGLQLSGLISYGILNASDMLVPISVLPDPHTTRNKSHNASGFTPHYKGEKLKITNPVYKV